MKTTFKSFILLIVSMVLFSSQPLWAHCDSYDGPVIKDAYKAMETNNVNLVLKWVNESQEAEIKELFQKTYNLKSGDKEIYTIVEKHFLETLVRLHRETEGAPYTGLKPAGHVAPIVRMADHSIETGSELELTKRFLGHIEKVVKEKFYTVNQLSGQKDQSVEQGRAYVEAYVEYVHLLEGIHGMLEHGAGGHEH
jgi:hypothetical protein